MKRDRLIAACVDPYCRVATYIATGPCPGCEKHGELLNELAVRGVGGQAPKPIEVAS